MVNIKEDLQRKLVIFIFLIVSCTMSSYFVLGKSLKIHPSYVNLPWVNMNLWNPVSMFPSLSTVK